MSCRKLSGLAALLVLAAGVSPALAEGPKPLPRPDSKPADHTRKVKLFVLLGYSRQYDPDTAHAKASLTNLKRGASASAGG